MNKTTNTNTVLVGSMVKFEGQLWIIGAKEPGQAADSDAAMLGLIGQGVNNRRIVARYEVELLASL